MSLPAPRVAILGGGILGLSCSLALQRAGCRVTVVDAPGEDAASWGNAGHIATEQAVPLASPASIASLPRRLYCTGGAASLPPAMAAHWLPFSLRLLAASTPARCAAGTAALSGLLAGALPAWRALVADIGAPGLLREDGHFVAWESAASANAGSAAWARADTGSATSAPASASDLARLRECFPGRVAGAIRFQGTGQVEDLAALAQALRQAVLAGGGVIERREGAIEFAGAQARLTGVDSELVVLAAGVRSRAWAERAGERAPMIAERGYHLRGPASALPAGLPPVAFEDRSLIVTRFASCVQVASFVEFAAPGAPPDKRKWERLEQHARALGLAAPGGWMRWMGARPTLPDYLPAIGRSQRCGNLIYAFGHQHLGLTLGPVTGGIVAALATGRDPGIDLAPFDLRRFR